MSMREWVYPKYSRTHVKRSGETLRNSENPFNEIDAMEALNNWKAAHELPLHYIMKTVKKYSNEISKISTIVQRRKRTESILLKLNQLPKLDLARMQDLVGFRIVFRHDDPKKNLACVDELIKKISTSRMRSKVTRSTDYIKNPRDSGYRSIHSIFKYNSNTYPDHKNMQVELQIRTKIQHYWATAVETVEMFERAHLKQGLGDKNWLEFFRLMSRLMAIDEGSTEVSDEEKKLLLKELRDVSIKIDASSRLAIISLQSKILQVAYVNIKKGMKSNLGYMLLRLDLKPMINNSKESADKTKARSKTPITITTFDKNDEFKATEQYSRMEKETHENRDVFVLLAKAQDVKSLKNGFPNYFADITEFIKIHREYLMVQ